MVRLLWPLALAVALLATGCAHAVMIDSQPHGADVYLGDEPIGQTPMQLDDPPSFGHSYRLTLKKAGFKDRTVVLQQKLNVGRAVLGVGAGVVGCVVGAAICKAVTSDGGLVATGGLAAGVVAGFPFFKWGWELPESHYSWPLEPGETDVTGPKFQYVPPPGETPPPSS